jgi:hypothetical protein
VHGQGWQVFGVLVVTFLLVIVADLLFASVANAVSGSDVAFAVAQLLGSAVTAPIFALASAVLYLELLQLKGEQLPPADMAGFSGER